MVVLLLGGGVGCARGGGEDGCLPLILLFLVSHSCELVVIIVVVLHIHGLIAQSLKAEVGGREGPSGQRLSTGIQYRTGEIRRNHHFPLPPLYVSCPCLTF